MPSSSTQSMPDQSYAEGIWRFMGGTPAVASLYQARAGHTLIGEIGVRRIREKSLVMTQNCIDWVDELGMKLNTPRAPELRGGAIVFDFASAADVCRELN
ncbi:MAG TPA: aminotransferase class V-fold PLP-dependent enzyme, partial [Kofleriaceae bacterium]|nr:aminotransferase class V-fold PLP-dependent enzyme [Kofleriaceae bacterium]